MNNRNTKQSTQKTPFVQILFQNDRPPTATLNSLFHKTVKSETCKDDLPLTYINHQSRTWYPAHMQAFSKIKPIFGIEGDVKMNFAITYHLFSCTICVAVGCSTLKTMSETLFRDFGPCREDSIKRLLQICRVHIHGANPLLHHFPKLLCWIGIWWLWMLLESSELKVMFEKPF